MSIKVHITVIPLTNENSLMILCEFKQLPPNRCTKMMSNNAISGVESVVHLQAEDAAHFHSESLDMLIRPLQKDQSKEQPTTEVKQGSR